LFIHAAHKFSEKKQYQEEEEEWLSTHISPIPTARNFWWVGEEILHVSEAAELMQRFSRRIFLALNSRILFPFLFFPFLSYSRLS
jgi:hypothetical protein